jgi:hypothetical protein
MSEGGGLRREIPYPSTTLRGGCPPPNVIVVRNYVTLHPKVGAAAPLPRLKEEVDDGCCLVEVELMSNSIRLCLFLLLYAGLATPASGQALTSPDLRNVRDRLSTLAFDPRTFFPDEILHDLSMIRITYTGDDYAWPVYSIAIAEGCIDDEAPSPACAPHLTARMVRAPAPSNMTRPRQRGLYLVEQLAERNARSRSQIRQNLRALGVEWMQADLTTCPGIREVLARSARLDWVPAEIRNPQPPGDSISLVFHADIVEVAFNGNARQSIYAGYNAEGSPGAWAIELAQALEPCWRPAAVPPPWTR